MNRIERERPVILDLGGENLSIIRRGDARSTNSEAVIRAALREIFAPIETPLVLPIRGTF